MTTQDAPATIMIQVRPDRPHGALAVYRKVCGWGWSHNSFGSSINDLNRPDVKTALETDEETDAAIMDSSGGHASCGLSGKDCIRKLDNHDSKLHFWIEKPGRVAKEDRAGHQ